MWDEGCVWGEGCVEVRVVWGDGVGVRLHDCIANIISQTGSGCVSLGPRYLVPPS